MTVPFEGARFFPSPGSKKAVVLLHSYTGSPMDVNMLARKLNRQGYTVLAPLFKGHRTFNMFEFIAEDTATWQAQTKEWLEWMDQQGFESLSVFGLSMGGVLATWAMAKQIVPIKSGGVFNAPVLTKNPIDIEASFLAYAKFIYEKDGASDYDKVEEEFIRAHRRHMAGLSQIQADIKEHIDNIEIPFFIAQSGKDELIDPSDAELLVSALENATVDYHTYPDCTHAITVNRNRQEFEDDLLDFLARTSE